MEKKKTRSNTKLGRDSKGKPVSLQSKSVKGFDSSDAKKLAQRRGDGLEGSMEKHHEPKPRRAK